MSTLLCAETQFSILQIDERAAVGGGQRVRAGRGQRWLVAGAEDCRGLPFDLRPRIGREFRLLAAGLGLSTHRSGLYLELET